MNKNGIKTIRDVDAFRNSHPVNGQIKSRYATLVDLYGEHNTDKMMRELEIKSWFKEVPVRVI